MRREYFEIGHSIFLLPFTFCILGDFKATFFGEVESEWDDDEAILFFVDEEGDDEEVDEDEFVLLLLDEEVDEDESTLFRLFFWDEREDEWEEDENKFIFFLDDSEGDLFLLLDVVTS